MILFKPGKNSRKNRMRRNWRWDDKRWNEEKPTRSSSDEYLEVNSVFGSVQKNIISKNFKGGDINVVFGGAEVNLSKADIDGTVILEINTVFGGTQVIVPTNWELKSELDVVMGGVEDKRPIDKDGSVVSGKVLILKGSVVFGGIELRSF